MLHGVCRVHNKLYAKKIKIKSLDNAKMNNASWIFWWPKFHSIDKFSTAFTTFPHSVLFLSHQLG